MALGTTGMVVVAALVAGAAGAGTTVLMRDSGKPAPGPAGADDRVAALEERVGHQQTEIASLRARLEEAAHAVPVQVPPPHAPGDEHHPAVPAQADAAVAGATEDMSPEEKAKFEAVYHRMREKEQEDQRKARLASVEAGLRTRLDKVPDKVALTAEQKEAIVKVLTERAEKIRAVFEESRTIGTPEAARAAQEKMVAIRQESRQTLLQTLTEDQVAAVEAVAERGGQVRATPAGLGGGGRRNGRGNGGAGGGNPPAGGGAEPGGGTTPPK